MAEQSSMNRLLTAQGCIGLDDLLINICDNCDHQVPCKSGKIHCKAFHAIMGMFSKLSAETEVGRTDIKSTFNALKGAI